MMTKENINPSFSKKENFLPRLFNLSLYNGFADGRVCGVLRLANHLYLEGIADKTEACYVEINPQGEIIKNRLINFKPVGVLDESLAISHIEDDRSSLDSDLHGVTAVANNWLWYPAVYRMNNNWEEEIKLRVFNNLAPGKNALPVNRQERSFFLYRPDQTPHQIWGYDFDKDKLVLKNSQNPDFVWQFLPSWWTERRVGLVGESFFLGNGQEFLPIHGQYFDQEGNIAYALGGCLVEFGENLEVTPLTNPFLTPKMVEDLAERRFFQAVPKKSIVYSCGALKRDDSFEMAVSIGDSQTFYLKTPWSQMEEYIISGGQKFPCWQLVWELKSDKITLR